MTNEQITTLANANAKKCDKCGEAFGVDGSWPWGANGTLCFTCWEAACSEAFWAMATKVSEANDEG